MKQITNIKKGISFLAILGLFVLAPVLASACSNLGPQKHMGVVLSVDPIKGTMALMDAETQETLHFVINESLLKKIHINDRIIIRFQEEQDQLIAKDLEVHASKKGVSFHS
ncbi:MAG: hypothetical protein VST69_09835 [Nitrospirota bacterium]|nr:hypothetical protein [Nitrospirota bacterium]